MDFASLCHLHTAIEQNDVEKVTKMSSADVINALYGKHTAMTQALESCSDDIILQALMEHPSFDPEASNRHQRTPLFEAAKLGRDDIVTCLLRMGAQVDSRDLRGVTPLGISALYNRHSTALILLQHGADVNLPDTSGNTALHQAASQGSVDVLSALLQQPDCEINRLNKAGKTALMLSMPSAYNVQCLHQPLSQSLAICRRLIQAGCDVSTAQCQPMSPLHDRVSQTDLVGACLLLHHHPQLVDSTDTQGMTPLEMTLSRQEDPDLYQMALCLLRHGASTARLLPRPLGVDCISDNANSSNDDNASSPASSSNPFIRPASDASSFSGDTRILIAFHKLRFLQALLSASFLTTSSVERLVQMQLLSPECQTKVLAALETQAEQGDGGRGDGIQSISSSAVKEEKLQRLLIGDGSSEGVEDVIYDTYDVDAMRCVCAAVRQSSSLQHQCRLAVRRLLGPSLRAKLPLLGLPQRVQNYVSLGPDMKGSSPLHVAEFHVAIAENDLGQVRRLLDSGVDVNSPFLEHTPLTRALELQPSHHDVVAGGDDVTIGIDDVCGLCGYHFTTSCKIEAENRSDEENGVLIGYPGTGPRDQDEDDIISLLIRYGASMTLKDPLGDTPLHTAVRRGVCVVRRLLSAVVSTATVCTELATAGISAHMKYEVSGNVDVHRLSDAKDDASQNTSCLGSVLVKSVDPMGTKDQAGLTPIEMAVLKVDLDTLKQLLYWTVATSLLKPNTAHARLFDTLQATHNTDSPVLNGETVDSVGSEGRVHAREKNPDLSGEAVKHVDVKPVTLVGKPERTPTSQRAHEENVPAAQDFRFKMMTGFDTGTLKDQNLSKLTSWVGNTGITALHCAAAAGLPDLIEILLKRGSVVNRKDTLGNTPLSVAADRGEIYMENSLFTPQQYANTWKRQLRVWPQCKPHTFPRHLILRPIDLSSQCRESTPVSGECHKGTDSSASQHLKSSAWPNNADEAQGATASLPQVHVRDTSSNERQRDCRIRHRPLVDYHLTMDILARYGGSQ